MNTISLEQVILSIIIGTLLAILYLLRVLVVMERRIARMDENIFRITAKVLKEEQVIESQIKGMARKKPAVKKPVRKPAKKKRK